MVTSTHRTTMNVVKGLLLVGALALIPTTLQGEVLQPTPCDVRKIMKVTTDETGKEILTSTITADCGYDSNLVKKHNQLKSQVGNVHKELAELKERMKSQEQKPAHIVIREIPKPVDLTKQYGDNKNMKETEWSWLEFAIGMLEGLRKDTL